MSSFTGYNIAKDIDAGAGLMNLNPFAVLAVYSFREQVTFSRDRLDAHDGACSVSRDPTLGAAVRPVLIIEDAVSLMVQSQKGSHLSSLAASLPFGTINYKRRILPDDWVLAWIVDGPEKAKDLVSRIRAGQPCNNFDDGLKFMGRVQSCRKRLRQVGSGPKQVSYALNAFGFKELDAQIFYDPQLALNFNTIGQWLGFMGKGLQDFIDSEGKGIDINRAIPTLLDLLVGSGIPSSFAAPGGVQIVTGQTSSDEAPFASVVPAEVGALLGRQSPSKPGGLMSYADLLELLFGLQRYQPAEDEISVFTPTDLRGAAPPPYLRAYPDGNRKFTGRPLLGVFVPQIPHFNKSSVWTILSQYLNPVVNEMYTTLRVNSAGKVVPTLVVRQLPFSTPKLAATRSQPSPDRPELTPFLELPRWILPSEMILEEDTGRSGVSKFNFIHAYAEAETFNSATNLTAQLIRNPPIRDDLDIQRSNLHPYMTTVSCSFQGTQDPQHEPRKWMEIIADFLMGQHLSENGTVTSLGVYAPIAIGDNLVTDDVVYHIESLIHSFSQSQGGEKTFVTSLNLSHGLRADPDADDVDHSMYPNLVTDDGDSNDPGVNG